METDAYPDSSFLVSLHHADKHGPTARSFLAKRRFPLIFTPLHRIEVRNALRNVTTRGDMTSSELRLAFQQLDEDLRDGILVHAPVEWTNVFRRADELSETHAIREGQRTIDLLHVAIALEAKARIFLSFDNRQRKLAKAAGLEVKP